MKKLIVLLLCLLIPASAFAGENGFKVAYDGGTFGDAKAGTEMRLILDGDHIRIKKKDVEVASIPASAVTEISYGQDVHRRIGAAIGVAIFSLGVGAYWH